MLCGTSPGSRRGVSALIAELLARAAGTGSSSLLSIPLLLPASRTLLTLLAPTQPLAAWSEQSLGSHAFFFYSPGWVFLAAALRARGFLGLAAAASFILWLSLNKAVPAECSFCPLGYYQILQGMLGVQSSLTCRAAAPVAPTQRSMLGRVQGLKPRQQRSCAAQLAHFINYAAQLRKPCPGKEMSEVIKYAFSGEMMQVVNENVTWDVNVCGDVKTSLSVFEFVQVWVFWRPLWTRSGYKEMSVLSFPVCDKLCLRDGAADVGLWCKWAFGAGQLLTSSEQCTGQCPPANPNSWAGLGSSKTWVIIPGKTF